METKDLIGKANYRRLFTSPDISLLIANKTQMIITGFSYIFIDGIGRLSLLPTEVALKKETIKNKRIPAYTFQEIYELCNLHQVVSNIKWKDMITSKDIDDFGKVFIEELGKKKKDV